MKRIHVEAVIFGVRSASSRFLWDVNAVRTEDYIFLVSAVVAYLAANGSASLLDLRRHTNFRFTPREISWVLKRLRKLNVVNYLGTQVRMWVLVGGETLLKPIMGAAGF